MRIRNLKKERTCHLIFILIIACASFVSYQLGLRHCEDKPAIIITKTEYIDDLCLCVKCSKRINFQEVQHLISAINEE
jgi:hypothetical protein